MLPCRTLRSCWPRWKRDVAGGRGGRGAARLGAKTDVVRHRDHAVAAVLREIQKVDIVVGPDEHVGQLRLEVLLVDVRAGDRIAAGAAAGNDDVGWVEQEIAGATVGRTRVRDTVIEEIALAGNFDTAAVAAVRAAENFDATAEAHRVVAPENHVAAVAELASARACDDRAIDRDVARVRHRGVASLPAATNFDGAAAERAAGVERGAAVEHHLATGHRDRAAATRRRRRIELAGNVNASAVCGITFKENAAIAFHQTGGLDDAGVVDDLIESRAGTARAQHDHAAFSVDAAAVFDGGAEQRAIDTHADQTVANEIQVHGVTGCEHRAPARCADLPRVAHARRDESHDATIPRHNATMIEHRSRRAVRGA
jgi:hypothetical protein